MTTIDELIEKLTYAPNEYKTEVHQALMRGKASREQQQAAASGIALTNYHKSQAASTLTSLQERNRKLEEALADILSAPSVVEAYGSICRARALLSGAGE